MIWRAAPGGLQGGGRCVAVPWGVSDSGHLHHKQLVLSLQASLEERTDSQFIDGGRKDLWKSRHQPELGACPCMRVGGFKRNPTGFSSGETEHRDTA